MEDKLERYGYDTGLTLGVIFALGDWFGGYALYVVAGQVQRVIRAEDVLARYGGEEFVVLVRGIDAKSVGVIAGQDVCAPEQPRR